MGELLQHSGWTERGFISRLTRLPGWLRYLLSMVMIAAALGLRFMLPIESGLVFLTFYLAVALAALVLGPGPGVLATLLGALIAPYYFMPPFGQPTPLAHQLAPVVTFVISGFLVCLLAWQIGKRAAALRVSEQRFRDFSEASADWFWEMNADLRFSWLSPAFERMSGVSPAKLLGRSAGYVLAEVAIMGEGDRQEWLHRLLRREVFRQQSFLIRDDDNTLREFVVGGVPVFDEYGQFAGYRGSGRRLTNQLAAELEADRAERLLREAVEAIATGFSIYDRDDRLVICNEAYRRMYAVSRDLLLPGRRFEDIVRIGAGRGQYAQAVDDPEAWVQARVAQHQHPDGGLFEQQLGDGRWLAVVESRTPSGYIVGNRIDISAHKQAEAGQRRLARALRLLSDCNALVIHSDDEGSLLAAICRLMVDQGGYRIAWAGFADQALSPRIQAVAQRGLAPGSLEGLSIDLHPSSPDGDTPMARAIRSSHRQMIRDAVGREPTSSLSRLLVGHGCHAGVVLPLPVAPDEVGMLALHATRADAFADDELSLLDELAENIAYGIRSLRERRELEGSRQALERNVAERTREIGQLNLELAERARESEAANQAKSRFLAVMSHEIRTPLNAVIGLAELLGETSLNRSQSDSVRKIQSASESLRALIDDILDMSRIEAGAVVLASGPFLLGRILQTLTTIVAVGTRGKPVELIMDVDPAVPEMLVGDGMRLQQILLNLASNAAKFTAAGSILIAVRHLGAHGGAEKLCFVIRDTGIGIDPERLAGIFDSYAQADPGICQRYGGSGLGLAICARLAALMGGDITVDSTPGVGSEFRLTLALPCATAQPPSPPPLPALRLLIVDDHPLVREALARAARGLGCQVELADSGPAGLAALRSSIAAGKDFDCLLLDWQMPGMDGLEMLRQARADEVIRLPLVLLMAMAEAFDHLATGALDHEPDGLLVKPATPAALHEALWRVYTGETRPIEQRPKAGDCRLNGLRLLAAEDNDINRELMGDILRRAGARVELVSNGQQAVAAVAAAASPFDAVLMDLQMPVMDGYAAARAIRSLPEGRTLPVIAVTAHALAEDFTRAHQAGMNGVILKPVRIDELLDFIVNEHAGCREEAPKPPAPGAASTLGLPGLLPDALQRFGGNAVYYATILREFVVHHGEEVAAIRTLLARQAWREAARQVHQLAGIAAFLQASELPDLARQLETLLLAPTPDLPAIDRQAGLVDAAMTVLLGSVRRFVADAGEPGSTGKL